MTELSDRIASTSPLTYVSAAGAESTLVDVLRRRAELTPDDCFVSFEGQRVSYAGLVQRAEQAAAALADAGIGRGDKVAVMLPNSLEFLDLWFGGALLGSVLVPVNTGLRSSHLERIVRHSDADLFVAAADHLAECDRVLADGGGPRVRLALGETDGTLPPGWASAKEWLAGSYPRPTLPKVTPGDVASILYTSGTTGPSKGVLNVHNAFVVAAQQFCREHVGLRADDVLYTSLPLFHVNAQMLSTMGSLVSGRPLVLAPRFSASGIMRDIRAHGATIFNYIGAMLTMMAKQPSSDEDADNPARIAIGGAAPTDLWPQFEERFGLSIIEIYGLTETATFCLGGRPDDVRVGKIGTPVAWAEVGIEGQDGRAQPDGEPGEIVVRSTQPHTLFAGYYKDPDATDRAMRAGWFHTGDRGWRDDDGYFAFLDRIKDVIRRRGENISSFEVERVLNSHDDIAQSAVVGVPSDLGEEDVLAVVVPVDGVEIDPEALIDFCRQQMATYMVPRYIRLTDSLPRTATERVQKFVLRDEAKTVPMWDREGPA